MADYIVKDDVALININHFPVNSLNAEVRRGLYRCIKSSINDSKVDVIVIGGKGNNFSAGADITEFRGSGVGEFPNLLELINIFESCPKPIISAIHGYCLGGGLELALGCHYRVASSSAKFGFPEVNIGILPAAGGTQRFPRLVGLQNAIAWIVSGNHYSAKEAARIGVLDRVYPESLNIIDYAIQFSKSVTNKSLISRKISLLGVKDAVLSEKIVAAAKAKLADKSRGAIAPLMCLQAIANSTSMSYSKGLEKENELFNMLISSGQSQALRYAFFAERQVARWEAPNGVNFKNSKPIKVRQVAVIGLGTMGSGIAISFSTLGIPVYVLESNDEVLAKSVQRVRGIIDRMEKRGEITAEQCKSMQATFIPTNNYFQLKDVDLVVEAVFESLKLKKEVFRKLDEVCKPSTILASNTSTFDIDYLAVETRRPDKVAGMHFFAPAHRMKLLENVRGTHSSPQTLATIMDIGKKINHCAVLVGNCSAFAANRMYGLYTKESEFLLEEGAYPDQIDAALRQFGFAMGRFEVADLSGNDVGYRIRREYQDKENALKEGLRYCLLSDLLCERGRYGVKTGKGWYKFVDGKFQVDPEVTEMIDGHRKERNIAPRKIQPEEILVRMLYCMVNEGFKLMEEGIVSAPHDIDMIWIYGFAWPKHTGGLMYYAHNVGLPQVLEVIENRWQRFGKSEPQWKPSSMLVNLVKNHGNPPISQWMNLHRETSQSRL